MKQRSGQKILRFQNALTAIATITALSFAAPLSADVKSGVDAWSQGDYARAVAEWQDPAASGDTDALFNLAQAYRLGRGVPSDISKARDLYLEAALKGHIKAADNYGLLLFQQGEQAKAIPLIEAAAGRGDPRAQYIMGLAHFNADYAPKDWVRAYALLSLSQSAGLPQATKAIAQMNQYIPLEQRQEAQSLAAILKVEADRRLASTLAASDLGVTESVVPSQSTATPAPRAPTRTAASATPPTQTALRGLPPAPRPVQQYRLPTPQPLERAAVREPHRSSPPATTPTAPRPTQAVASPVAASSGAWGLQLGAFGVAANADRLWGKLQNNPALSGTRKSLVSSGRVTRLIAMGFASRNAAQSACSKLKAQGQDCVIKAP
ncbi:MAG: SPOR domain-containing protein [Pseudomonadota bacterium]